MLKNKKILAILCLTVFLIGAMALPAFALPEQARQAFDRRVTARVDIDNIWNHLEVLTVDIGPRFRGTAGEHVAAEYIADVFEGYGYEVFLQEFEWTSRGLSGTSYNVIATRKPNNKNKLQDEVLIVGAHYDSTPTTSPGANDNGGSVAVMLDMARVLASYPIERELMFIAFAAEEGGLLGARYFVDNLSAEEKDRVIGLINMEMLGSAYEPQERVFVATPDGSTNDLTDAIVDAGDRLAYWVPTARVGFSDHVPFHNAGIDAVVYARAYPGSIPWDPEGRWGLESTYHTANDTMETMCKDRLEEAAVIVSAAVYDIIRKSTPSLEKSAIRREVEFTELVNYPGVM